MTAPLPQPQTGDPRIIAELEMVRARRALAGGTLPAFRRGQMFFDFAAGKVRIASVEGGAA